MNNIIKNYKAATAWAVLYWVLIFVVISAVMFGLPQLNETIQSIIWLIIELFLIAFCAGMYFKKYSGNFEKGFFLGVWFLIVGTVLSLLVTIPIFVKSTGEFYSMWSLWVGFAITILGSVVAGHVMRKK